MNLDQVTECLLLEMQIIRLSVHLLLANSDSTSITLFDHPCVIFTREKHIFSVIVDSTDLQTANTHTWFAFRRRNDPSEPLFNVKQQQTLDYSGIYHFRGCRQPNHSDRNNSETSMVSIPCLPKVFARTLLSLSGHVQTSCRPCLQVLLSGCWTRFTIYDDTRKMIIWQVNVN